MVNKLPTTVTLGSDVLGDLAYESVCDDVVDYLSNKYGYCVNGYSIAINITVKDVDWDTSE